MAHDGGEIARHWRRRILGRGFRVFGRRAWGFGFRVQVESKLLSSGYDRPDNPGAGDLIIRTGVVVVIIIIIIIIIYIYIYIYKLFCFFWGGGRASYRVSLILEVHLYISPNLDGNELRAQALIWGVL